jgi:hypothetical protein
MLSYGYNYHFPYNLKKIDSTIVKSFPVAIGQSINDAFGPRISAEPIPAKNWIAFNYELSSDQSNGILRITDISGRIVTEFSVKGRKGQHIWDVRQVKPGMYNYILMEAGLIKSGKLVIQ